MDRNHILLLIFAGITQGYSSCRDTNGRWKEDFVYTRLEDCEGGVYYQCETEAVCPTNHIAGPHPNGYECMEDCIEMGMCWDNRTSKCLCVNTQNCPKERPQRSNCPYRSFIDVTCNPAASLEVYPDVASCSHFYFCVFGDRYRFECPQGQFFEQNAPSYCDVPENLSRPCNH